MSYDRDNDMSEKSKGSDTSNHEKRLHSNTITENDNAFQEEPGNRKTSPVYQTNIGCFPKTSSIGIEAAPPLPSSASLPETTNNQKILRITTTDTTGCSSSEKSRKQSLAALSWVSPLSSLPDTGLSEDIISTTIETRKREKDYENVENNNNPSESNYESDDYNNRESPPINPSNYSYTYNPSHSTDEHQLCPPIFPSRNSSCTSENKFARSAPRYIPPISSYFQVLSNSSSSKSFEKLFEWQFSLDFPQRNRKEPRNHGTSSESNSEGSISENDDEID
ncbi:hypothetical protein DASC09_037780 [Saccharomycopsis crataegensis]|uniref:Uncharacterized protein n=1 Tax=Saccharomycopsis crataegensis TaxID=43959 RepID=A0AAV5QNK1_9ASCO|nr:hypothetical protein DASC09_037780 [Saccharomycopsis crataegensis]